MHVCIFELKMIQWMRREGNECRTWHKVNSSFLYVTFCRYTLQDFVM